MRPDRRLNRCPRIPLSPGRVHKRGTTEETLRQRQEALLSLLTPVKEGCLDCCRGSCGAVDAEKIGHVCRAPDVAALAGSNLVAHVGAACLGGGCAVHTKIDRVVLDGDVGRHGLLSLPKPGRLRDFRGRKSYGRIARHDRLILDGCTSRKGYNGNAEGQDQRGRDQYSLRFPLTGHLYLSKNRI